MSIGIGPGIGVGIGGSAGGAATGFPGSAALLLYASDAAGGTPVIRNRATTAPIPANLLGNARTAEHPYRSTLKNSMTRTAPVVSFDGATKAVRYTYVSGTSPFGRLVERRLAAGTYTLQVDAKSETGSNCIIRIGGVGSSYLSPDKTVTTTPGTFSHTFTLAAETTVALDICAGTGGAAFDVTVDNMAIVAGSSPITTNPAVDPHVMVPPSVKNLNMSGSVISSTASLKGSCRFTLGSPEAVYSAISIVAAVWMDPATAETASTIFPILAELESATELNGLNGLFFGPSSTYVKFAGAATALATQCAGPWKAGWCVMTITAGATGIDMWVNRVKVASTSTAYSGGTFSAVELLNMRDSFPFVGKLACLGMWTRKLSEGEVGAAYTSAVEQIAAHGETFTDYNTFWIAEGDSITYGSSDNLYLGGYIGRAGRLFSTRLQAVNYAVPGASLAISPPAGANNINAANRIAAVDAKIAEVTALGKRAIVSALIGANNDFSSDPTWLFNLLKTYTDGRKALGAKIVVQTLTDQSVWDATKRTNVGIFNQMLRDGVTSGYFDACVDHAATAMGTWSGTNFSDGVHPNATGYTLMASTFQTAIDAAGLII